ncbi:MAG: PKD domain-containing protein [Thermoplasmata archaeon]
MNKAVVITAILILSLIFFPGCIRLGENLPPEPNLKASAVFIDVNETVTFYANDSYDRDGEIVKYYWDFDDGTNATGKYASHDYEEGGNYTIILIVTDDNNKKAVQTMTIHVNELPRPDMNISLPAYIHEEVYFQANDTYDPDGFVMDYFWDFGDGTNDTGMSVSHVYTSKEWFRVTLTVTDNDDANAATSREFEVQFRTYQVTWDTYSLEVGKFNGYNEEEESEHRQKNINVLNMTKLVFVLTWDDDKPYLGDPPLAEPEPNDEFIMNITSPTDKTYEGGPSTEEQIIVNAPSNGNLNEIPEPFDIPAESKEILEMDLAVNWTKTNGIGEWSVNITLTQALGFWGGPPDSDLGEDWDLVTTCFYYYPVITKL